MRRDIRIINMAVGDEFEGFYVLKTAQNKVSNNGKPYLNATVSDCTGDIDAKVWDYPGPLGPNEEGKVVKLRGTVSEYRGSLQATVDRIRLAEENDEYDLRTLVPVAPMDAQAGYQELLDLVASIEDQDYRDVTEALLERHGETLRRMPAAKSVHHSFLNGLLMHTLNMMRQADFLAKLYAGIVDRSLLLAGTCLHDLGKEWEFEYSELGLVTEYSTPGQLLGHLVMGAQEVSDAARGLGIPEEKGLLLQHMLLSHHGEPEFGAAVRPMCAEAELLSLIDKIDSRMEIYKESLENVEPGQFSGRIFALEKRIYKHQ